MRNAAPPRSLFASAFFVLVISIYSSAKQAPPIPIPPATLHEMSGAFWRTDATFHAKLRISNIDVEHLVSVTPIIYGEDGTKATLARVDVPAGGAVVIDIEDALGRASGKKNGNVGHFGNAVIQYKTPFPVIRASIENIDIVRSLVFNSTFAPSDTPSPAIASKVTPNDATEHRIEALWWKQFRSVEGTVALLNVGETSLEVALSASGSAGGHASHHVAVPAHGTSMVKIEDLMQGESEGGVTVTYGGPQRSLMAFGLLQETGKGYSAVMSIAYPTELKNPNPHIMHFSSPGIMSGEQPMMGFPKGTNFAPYAVIRNTSNKPLGITPRLYYMEGMGMAMDTMSATLPAITLSPLETRRLDITTVLRNLHLDKMTASLNLTFEGQMVGGDLLIANGSVDNTGNYVFEVAAQAESAGVRRACYWELENGSDTMLTVWNFGDQDEDLMVTFTYAGGAYRMPLHIGKKQFHMFNAGEIVQANVPDDKGNRFPASALRGAIMVENGDDAEFIHRPSITVTPQTFNVKTATCGAGCYDCMGPSDYTAVANFNAAVGDSMSLSAYGHDSGSHPTLRNYTTSSTWSSNNTSIATIGTNTGVASLLSEGSDMFFAQSPVPGNSDPCWWNGYEECASELPVWPVQGTVTPKITGPNTVWYFNGQTPSGYNTTITLTSSGGSSTTWAVTAGSTKVTLSATTGTSIDITSSGSAFSAPAANDISITATAAGQTSAPFTITSRTPTSLSFVSWDNNPNDLFVWHTTICYDISDNLNTLMPSPVPVNEAWTSAIVRDYPSNTWQRKSEQNVSATSDANPYRFCDQIDGDDPGVTPTPVLVGTSDPIVHWGQKISVGRNISGLGKPVQKDSLQKYLTYADHISKVTPWVAP
ncbi:MAG: hypothetical protein JWO13_446 [Acidobacteriales bacterium]|nr:hypothetical protein [Terriglobales bacterium]